MKIAPLETVKKGQEDRGEIFLFSNDTTGRRISAVLQSHRACISSAHTHMP